MRTVRNVADLRSALVPPRRRGERIALVPTMGALHEGHLSLIRRARADADIVVVSVFVNPTQFGPGEDLAAYPRDEQLDAHLADEQGTDLLFAPTVEEVYPMGFATTVHVGRVTEGLCGAQRGAGHFDGVATIVTKLLNMVAPDVAFFGQKDAQQAVVIKRLVRDLSMPVEIQVCATVREPDGLAMSSRNAYLEPAERRRALALRRSLDSAQHAVEAGERDAATVLAAARAELAAEGVQAEYLELVTADELEPVQRIGGDVLVAVAARVGKARLIDNVAISTTRSNTHANANGRVARKSPCSA